MDSRPSFVLPAQRSVRAGAGFFRGPEDRGAASQRIAATSGKMIVPGAIVPSPHRVHRPVKPPGRPKPAAARDAARSSRPARVRRKRGGSAGTAANPSLGPRHAQTLGIDREFRAALRELHSLKGAIDEEERITSRHGARARATEPATAATGPPGAATDAGANAEPATSPVFAPSPLPANEAGVPGRATEQAGDAAPASPALGHSATRERLRLAEGVMRKLYRRNMELERAVLGAGRPGSARSLGNSSEPARPGTSVSTRTAFVVPDDVVSPALQLHAKTEEHLQQLLAQRDGEISRLRNQLAKREAEALQARQGAGRTPSTPTSEQRAAGAEIVRLREDGERVRIAYDRLRREHDKLLKQRAKEAGRHTAFSSGDPTSEPLRQARSSLKALQQRMAGMAKEHEAERRLLNDKLGKAERKHCDWFVERRLLQDEVAGLSRQLHERDALDERIEGCIHGLFQRLQQVEARNMALTHALEKAGAEIPATPQGTAREGGEDGEASPADVLEEASALSSALATRAKAAEGESGQPAAGEGENG